MIWLWNRSYRERQTQRWPHVSILGDQENSIIYKITKFSSSRRTISSVFTSVSLISTWPFSGDFTDWRVSIVYCYIFISIYNFIILNQYWLLYIHWEGIIFFPEKKNGNDFLYWLSTKLTINLLGALHPLLCRDLFV